VARFRPITAKHPNYCLIENMLGREHWRVHLFDMVVYLPNRISSHNQTKANILLSASVLIAQNWILANCRFHKKA